MYPAGFSRLTVWILILLVGIDRPIRIVRRIAAGHQPEGEGVSPRAIDRRHRVFVRLAVEKDARPHLAAVDVVRRVAVDRDELVENRLGPDIDIPVLINVDRAGPMADVTGTVGVGVDLTEERAGRREDLDLSVGGV